MKGSLTNKLEKLYLELFDEATIHAACYIGYPAVQESILADRDETETMVLEDAEKIVATARTVNVGSVAML